MQVMSAKPDREAILPYIKVCQQLIRCGRMLEAVSNRELTRKTPGPTQSTSQSGMNCFCSAELFLVAQQFSCLLLSTLQAAALPDQGT